MIFSSFWFSLQTQYTIIPIIISKSMIPPATMPNISKEDQPSSPSGLSGSGLGSGSGSGPGSGDTGSIDVPSMEVTLGASSNLLLLRSK